MKEIIKCVHCGGFTDILYKCDMCGENKWLPILTLIIDLEEYHFCNYKCLLQFILGEIKKEKKNEKE